MSDRIAFSFCHQIARSEGLLLGASTGAILAGGLAYTHAVGKTDRPLSILMLNPDRGDRYLETVYDAPQERLRQRDWLKANQIELFSPEQLAVEVQAFVPIKFT